MFLGPNWCFKDGKKHRYFSVEESRRLRSVQVVQRRVLYLGEINHSQQAAWRKTLEVFDEAQRRYTWLNQLKLTPRKSGYSQYCSVKAAKRRDRQPISKSRKLVSVPVLPN